VGTSGGGGGRCSDPNPSNLALTLQPACACVNAELAHIDPPRPWGVRSIDGPIRATVDVAVEPLVDNRSRLTITVDFKGHGIGKLLIPLVVEREARKEMPSNLSALKERLERDR